MKWLWPKKELISLTRALSTVLDFKDRSQIMLKHWGSSVANLTFSKNDSKVKSTSVRGVTTLTAAHLGSILDFAMQAK